MQEQNSTSLIQAKSYVNEVVMDLKRILQHFHIVEQEIKDDDHIKEIMSELKDANLEINNLVLKKLEEQEDICFLGNENNYKTTSTNRVNLNINLKINRNQ